MKTALLPVLALFIWASAIVQVNAADDTTATLSTLDDARVAALKAADGTKLKTLLSDELRYAHSNGNVDDKNTFIENVSRGRSKYVVYDYEERNFSTPAPGIALMTGRAKFKVESVRGVMESGISFLAVWRQENGQWRFLAWQSCKIPPAAPATR